MIRVVSIVLLMLALYSLGFGQQIPYGYISAGHDGIVSNAFIVRDGFVLDSATNITWVHDPQNPTKTTYRFEYDEKGRLVSDSNLFTRADPYKSGRFTLYKYRPGRNTYIYNEKGAVDSIARAFWVDSVWENDPVGWKFIYSSDGKLISSRYLPPDIPRTHDYVYDGSGRLLVDTSYTGVLDPTYVYREYDSQNRLSLIRWSSHPSLGYYWTVYDYSYSGIVHSVTRSLNSDSSIWNVDYSYLTFDESGKLVKDSTCSDWVSDRSDWGPYELLSSRYDENGRILTYGLNSDDNRYTYTPEGNLDTLVCMHPVAPYFLGAHFLDAYGNDISLPQYNPITKLYYRQLVTGIEKREGPDKSFVLFQNYPNPFNPSTTIEY
ncbi:MAG TPA: hypothetical protein VMG09_10445, partial [Bacteroidota bacterium]|nr:hypothetical protein [Bacteroidota bacterium]